MTITAQVQQASEQLKPMTRPQLFDWAGQNGMNSRAAFPRFKKALAEIGVDYATAGVQSDDSDPLARAIKLSGKSCRVWERDDLLRLYLTHQRGTDLYVWIKKIDGRVENFGVSAFVSTAQARKWIANAKADALASAEPLIHALALVFFGDRVAAELNDDQAAKLAAARIWEAAQ